MNYLSDNSFTAYVGIDWRIQLPKGLSVAFSGTVDAGTLSTVLATAAAVD